MNNDFICNPKYDEEIFKKVYELKNLKHWEQIDKFMGREYAMKWLRFKGEYKVGTILEINEWQKAHDQTIVDFLKYINSVSDNFILKGGTALAQCYKLDRFSEDINLDATKENIIPHIVNFANLRNFRLCVTKDTSTVKECFLDYGNIEKPLKIEVSYRNKFIDPGDVTLINGIKVYNVNILAQMKAYA